MPNYGHLSLSCAKIERPSPLEKPSCKVQLFAQNRSRNYRQKVTATTLFQTASYSDFQLLLQTPHVCFRRRKRAHTRLRQQDRTQRLTRRNTGLPDGAASMTALVELGQEAIRSISAELHKHPAVWMFRQDAQFDGEMRQEARTFLGERRWRCIVRKSRASRGNLRIFR